MYFYDRPFLRREVGAMVNFGAGVNGVAGAASFAVSGRKLSTR
jgi:hypothetical protein